MRQGIVFDIQHYAMHDGPGIRTIVFLKGCPLACLWCCNPESQRFPPELRHNRFACRACFDCQKACPRQAIRAEDGMLAIDRRTCGGCSAACVEACPQGALDLVGETMTSDQVMARIAADKPFYDNSGGGVTFSGGEPFAQPAFLAELLSRSKLISIHTAVETCGVADPCVLARCEPLVDLFLFDLKVIEYGLHERLTGSPNFVILRNLRTLAARARGRLTVRVPIVPGCTDGPENLRAIAAFISSIGIGKVQLLPYHALGVDKYASFGREYRLGGVQSPAPSVIEDAARIFCQSGVACDTEGE